MGMPKKLVPAIEKGDSQGSGFKEGIGDAEILVLSGPAQ